MIKKFLTERNYVDSMPILGAMLRQIIESGTNVIVEVKEHKAKRSTAQNRLMWMWNQAIAEHLREHFGQENSSQDVHEVLVRKKFGVRVLEVAKEEPIIVRKRTRRLSTKEFSEYLEWMDMYCAENLGLLLPRPEELYSLAVYGEDDSRILN